MNNITLSNALEDFLKTPLENGVEPEGRQPLGDLILKSVRDLSQSEDAEYIKESLVSLNGFLKDEFLQETYPNLSSQISDSLKDVFDVPRTGLGLPTSDSALNDVLLQNEELSASLFMKMADQNLRVDSEGKKTLDMDISSVLYLGQLQSFLPQNEEGKDNSLLNSPVINKILKRNDVQEHLTPKLTDGDNSMSDLINDFKPLDSLVVVSDKIKDHIEYQINKNNKNPKNEKMSKNILDVAKMVEGEFGEESQEFLKNKTEEERLEEAKNKKRLRDGIEALELKFKSAKNLDDDLKNIVNENEAAMKAKNKEADEYRTKEEQMFLTKTSRESLIDLFDKHNIKSFNTAQKMRGEHEPHGKTKSWLSTSLYQDGSRIADISPISGVAKFNRAFQTDPVALQATFSFLREKNPPKENEEFNLYLSFRGQKRHGIAYIEASINAAMNMEPPVPLDCINVDKRFEHVLEKYKNNDNAFVSNAPTPEMIKADKDRDSTLDDLKEGEDVEKDMENKAKSPSNTETPNQNDEEQEIPDEPSEKIKPETNQENDGSSTSAFGEETDEQKEENTIPVQENKEPDQRVDEKQQLLSELQQESEDDTAKSKKTKKADNKSTTKNKRG